MCTKPLGARPQKRCTCCAWWKTQESFHGYLEDLVYTPKTLKALASVREGAIGDVLWVRSRETHPGPHSDWFWDPDQAGGGAMIDMGCHCIEIARNFIGKDVRPMEVVCWADTLVHPIETEDHAIGLVRYENGAIGQFEVSWAFRGGMDLRDEISGTRGNDLAQSLAAHRDGDVLVVRASWLCGGKSRTAAGWLFPVGDEAAALGYRRDVPRCAGCLRHGGRLVKRSTMAMWSTRLWMPPMLAARSKRWEPVNWPNGGANECGKITAHQDFDDEHYLIKRERMPDGATKLILRRKESGEVVQRLE